MEETRPYITRYAYKRSLGWLVRYYAHGQTLQRLVSDSRYGDDPARSLQAAQHAFATLAQTIAPRPVYRIQRSPRNKTGRIGVCLLWKKERKGQRVPVYSVNWTLAGRRRTKVFRLHRYPSQMAAWHAAVIFREHQEHAMQVERIQALRALYPTQEHTR